MTESSIAKLHGIAIQATTIFTKLYTQSVISCGAIGSAVIIDCGLSQLRLALITIDEKPGMVGVGIGNKESGQSKILSEIPLGTLTASDIIKLMENHFKRK